MLLMTQLPAVIIRVPLCMQHKAVEQLIF